MSVRRQKAERAVVQRRRYERAMNLLKRAAIAFYLTPGISDDPVPEEARALYKKNFDNLIKASCAIAVAEHERCYSHPGARLRKGK